MQILQVPFEGNTYCFTDADEQTLKRVHSYSEQLLKFSNIKYPSLTAMSFLLVPITVTIADNC